MEYSTGRSDGGRGLVIGVGLVAIVALIGAGLLVFLGTPTPPASEVREGPVRVVATIPPLAWAARELAPNAEVTVLRESEASAHGMELTASEARLLSEADVVLLVGLGLDDAAARVVEAHPREGREVIRLEDSLELAGVDVLGHAALEDAHDHDHDHDHDHGHDHGGHDHDHAHAVDPHAWLDPLVMRVYVGRVGGALGRVTGGSVTAGLVLQERCETIHEMYELALSGVTRREMVVHHNAYGYLANRYGLSVVGVIQPADHGEVRPGDVAHVVNAVERYRLGAIFVDPGHSTDAAERIAEETGVRLLALDPVGRGDWPELMTDNLKVLIEGLTATPSDGAAGVGVDGAAEVP